MKDITLEGYKFEANSFPTKELVSEPTLTIMEVEKFILMSDEDEERALATMDEGLKQSYQTSMMNLAGL